MQLNAESLKNEGAVGAASLEEVVQMVNFQSAPTGRFF
jgi:hypothetical protein